MKKIVKKAFHKPEAERTKTQKILRDVAFFGVVVYAAVMTFLLINAQANKADLEMESLSAQMNAHQVALLR